MASFGTEHTLESLGEYTTQLGTLTNSIDFGILVLTIIGAAGVMISMLYKEYKIGKGSTVRSRLVLFLVFGDLFLGVIAIIPTISTLAGNHPKPFTPYCNALGFLIATALYAQHFNTLTLCISTYLILIYPLSLYTRWLERHWRWLFPFVWFSSFLCAGIAWGVIQNWGYNNGLCIYPSGLFSEIWQFIPRAIVFTVITLLYLRLFVFLRRPDKIRTGSSSTDNQTDRSTELDAEPSHPSSQSHSKWRRFSSRTRTSHTESTGLTAQLNGWIRSKSLGHDDRNPKALDFAEPPRRASLPLSVETSEIGTGEENNSRPSEYPPFATSGGNKSRSYVIPSTFGSSFGGGHRRKSRAGLPPWENVDLPRFPGSIDPITAVDPLDIEPSYPPPVTAGWKWGLSAPDSNSDFGGQGYSADQSACLPSSSPTVTTAANKTNIAGTKTSNMVPKPKPADESNGDPPKDVSWDNLAVRRSSHVSFSEGSSLATYNFINSRDPPSVSIVLPNSNAPPSIINPTILHPSPSSSPSPTSFAAPVVMAAPTSTTISSFKFPPSLENGPFVFPRQVDQVSYLFDPSRRPSIPDSVAEHPSDLSDPTSSLPPPSPSPPLPPSPTIITATTADDSSMIDRNRSTSRSRTMTLSDRTGTESLQVSPGRSFPLSESSTSSTSMSNAMTLIDPLDSRRSSAVTQPTDQSYGINFSKKKSNERDQDHPLLSLTVDRRELDEEANLMSWQAGRRGNAQTEEENDDYDDLDEGDLTLKRVLELTDPAIDGLITPGGGGGGGRGELNAGRRITDSGAGISSGSDNQESMARFMNRKASLLMLTFPLAYVVLFSVSIIRIVWDFGPNTPSPVFTAISRWMIFMQGLLDAVIYGLVETLVKRQVKKKTRRVLGTGLGTGGSHSDPRASVANTRTDTASRI